jgi:hypothetical protein
MKIVPSSSASVSRWLTLCDLLVKLVQSTLFDLLVSVCLHWITVASTHRSCPKSCFFIDDDDDDVTLKTRHAYHDYSNMLQNERGHSALLTKHCTLTLLDHPR